MVYVPMYVFAQVVKQNVVLTHMYWLNHLPELHPMIIVSYQSFKLSTMHCTLYRGWRLLLANQSRKLIKPPHSVSSLSLHTHVTAQQATLPKNANLIILINTHPYIVINAHP